MCCADLPCLALFWLIFGKWSICRRMCHRQIIRLPLFLMRQSPAGFMLSSLFYLGLVFFYPGRKKRTPSAPLIHAQAIHLILDWAGSSFFSARGSAFVLFDRCPAVIRFNFYKNFFSALPIQISHPQKLFLLGH